MRRILLVEPGYRNKYPPLGLMKVSAYHKLLGDYVEFVKGCSPLVRQRHWDRIYISTLFTFYWKETIRTIQYYKTAVASPTDVFVGGVMATLLKEDIERETGVMVICGLLDKPYILDRKPRLIVDHLIPDYSILKEANYQYDLEDSYIAYATRGCPNSCEFCAVRKIEPEFINYLPLRRQIRAVEEMYGPKQHLILLDNNVLASCSFEKIILDILDLGFERGTVFRNRLRFIDFNQGLDARRLSRKKMRLLAKTAIRPLRLAFDFAGMKKDYIRAVKLACDCGVLNISTYVLYNFLDTPSDFYDRLKINVRLNEELGAKIYSFPMKFIPLNAKDRAYVGEHWNRQLIRGVQCILLATHGLVTPRREFFEAAFGRSSTEFMQIAMMPEQYIIYRRKHERNGAMDWTRLYNNLTLNQRNEFLELVSAKRVQKQDVTRASTRCLKRLLSHYVESN